MIEGLFETHLNVADLERSVAFYRDVLGLEEAKAADARRVAFFWIGNRGEYMLGLWEKPPEQIQRQHFAFRVSRARMMEATEFLKARNLAARNFLNDGTSNPMVFAWMPAVAIYFSDPDNHSLEFIAMLPDEPQPERGIVAWDEWEAMHGRSL